MSVWDVGTSAVLPEIMEFPQLAQADFIDVICVQ